MGRGRSTVQSLTLPAPLGGTNTIAPIGGMPASDLIYGYNVIASELGLRARLGYQEWVTGLTGAADSVVRTVMPFTGTKKNGSTDRLFACTSSGIWDCTTSTATPTKLVTFTSSTGDAGYGTFTEISTAAGRYLVYCDEENGAFIYSESATTWTQLLAGPTVIWSASTPYQVGNIVTNGTNSYICTLAGVSAASGGPTGQGVTIVDGAARWNFYRGQWAGSTAYALACYVVNASNIYVCTQAGTSASSGGPSSTGTGIVDGTCRWNYVSAFSPPVGTSLADQQLGYTANPGNFVAPVVWKNRLWFCEKDTTRAWYLDVNSLYGTATSFNFGFRMRAGGPLAGLYNWSYDAGNGMDAVLVAVSTTGDVVIYQGTDPSSVSTFGMKGTWSVGAVPYGRRLATDWGGDLLLLSTSGIVPMSRLVVGQPVVAGDRSLYSTEKVTNLFSQAATANRLLQGWQVVLHPEDAALMVLLPSQNGAASSTQLVMPFATRGWYVYRDLGGAGGVSCAAPFAGKLYFGTADGRVCINTGYVDGITLASPGTFSPVQYSFLTAYSNLGTTKQKRVLMVRPSVLSQQPNPTVRATPRFRFDTSEPGAPSAFAVTGSNIWDTAVWDSSRWGGDYQAQTGLAGGAGVGREMALAVRGQAVSRTIFVSADVFYDVGGDL